MIEDQYTAVIDKYNVSLDTNAKQGVFLLGAFTQILLDIQQKKRSATPFYKQLKGLKMNQRDVQGLLSKVVDKLTAYDEYSPRMKELAEAISQRMLSDSASWRLSIDELNFYFVSGMAISREISAIVYKKREE